MKVPKLVLNADFMFAHGRPETGVRLWQDAGLKKLEECGLWRREHRTTADGGREWISPPPSVDSILEMAVRAEAAEREAEAARRASEAAAARRAAIMSRSSLVTSFAPQKSQAPASYTATELAELINGQNRG